MIPKNASCETYIIEIRVHALDAVYHSLDPSPLPQRDLDPRTHEYILQWASDAPPKVPILLRLLVPAAAHSVANIADLTEAIPRFFSEEALLLNRQHIRNRGRAIRWFSGGLFIMLGLLSLNFLCVHLFPGSMLMEVAGEAFVIAGWVSLWIPMERFGFDGWLLRDKLRVYTRLSALTLEVVYET